MTDIALDSKEDVKSLNDFIAKIKDLKRQFEKANKTYQDKGVISFSASFRDSIFHSIEDIKDLYTDFTKSQV